MDSVPTLTWALLILLILQTGEHLRCLNHSHSSFSNSGHLHSHNLSCRVPSSRYLNIAIMSKCYHCVSWKELYTLGRRKLSTYQRIKGCFAKLHHWIISDGVESVQEVPPVHQVPHRVLLGAAAGPRRLARVLPPDPLLDILLLGAAHARLLPVLQLPVWKLYVSRGLLSSSYENLCDSFSGNLLVLAISPVSWARLPQLTLWEAALRLAGPWVSSANILGYTLKGLGLRLHGCAGLAVRCPDL